MNNLFKEIKSRWNKILFSTDIILSYTNVNFTAREKFKLLRGYLFYGK